MTMGAKEGISKYVNFGMDMLQGLIRKCEGGRGEEERRNGDVNYETLSTITSGQVKGSHSLLLN